MRIEKLQLASFASNLIKNSDFLFFITYKGLNVDQFTEFRDKLYSVNAKCHVLKNSLIRLGLESNQINLPPNFILLGDTAAVFGNGDSSSAAKVIKDFGKKSEIVTFKSALLDGGVLDANEAAAIAELPPKEILRAQLLGVLQAPMTDVVRVFNAKLVSLIYLLQAYMEKKETSS